MKVTITFVDTSSTEILLFFMILLLHFFYSLELSVLSQSSPIIVSDIIDEFNNILHAIKDKINNPITE